MDAFLGLSGILLIVAAVICIIVFGIILIVKVTKKKPQKRMVIALGSSVGGLVIGIILFSIGLSITPTNNTDNYSSDLSTNSADLSANDTSNSDSNFDDSSSSTENISLNTAKSASQLKSAAIKADPDNVKSASIRDGIAVIELKNNGEWDEKTTVQNFALRATDLLKEEKSNPNFDSFAFIRKEKFVDEKGNESTETALIAYFTKKNAQSIKYDNFSQIVDLNPYKFYDVADGYFIHPAIYKKVESSFRGLDAYKNSSDRKLSDEFSEELSTGY